MNFLGHPYYVGFLSAAALHSASHQAAMVFHIVTTARLRSRTIGTRLMNEMPIDLTALEHHVAATFPVPLATHWKPTGSYNNR